MRIRRTDKPIGWTEKKKGFSSTGSQAATRYNQAPEAGAKERVAYKEIEAEGQKIEKEEKGMIEGMTTQEGIQIFQGFIIYIGLVVAVGIWIAAKIARG